MEGHVSQRACRQLAEESNIVCLSLRHSLMPTFVYPLSPPRHTKSFAYANMVYQRVEHLEAVALNAIRKIIIFCLDFLEQLDVVDLGGCLGLVVVGKQRHHQHRALERRVEKANVCKILPSNEQIREA